MSIYGNKIKESVLTESYLLEQNLNKDDITDEKKVTDKIKKEKKPENAILIALKFIGIIILTIPIAIGYMIIFSITDLIKSNVDKLDYDKKDKEINNIIKKYNKNIDSLKEKLNKETDKEERQKIKDTINTLEKSIEELERKRTIEVDAKKYKYYCNEIEEILNNPMDYYHYIYKYAFYLKYTDINEAEFIRKFTQNRSEKIEDMDGFIHCSPINEKDCADGFYEYYLKNKNVDVVSFNLNGDSGIFWNCKKKEFVVSYDDWTEFKVFSYNEFKNSVDNLWFNKNDLDKYVEADRILGYYRLSKPPKNIKPKELPNSK